MSPLYNCPACTVDQPICTTATKVAHTYYAAWVAVCECAGCGEVTPVVVSEQQAAEICWWLVSGAQQRAYARAAGLDPYRLDEMAAELVDQAERITRAAAMRRAPFRWVEDNGGGQT